MNSLDALSVPLVLGEAPEGERLFQGIPGVAWGGGTDWYATWYGGGADEGPDNYALLSRSRDGGLSWEAPHLFVAPAGKIRAFDPTLWRDPAGRLWWFWAQADLFWDGRAGVWAMICEDPTAEMEAWSEPRRLCHGIMMNKPTVARDGTWLLPVTLWDRGEAHPKVAEARLPVVVVSRDQGETFEWRGGAKMPERSFDEHHVLELRDGRWVMYARSTRKTATRSFSSDGGFTWSPGEFTSLPAPDSRFYVGALRSGRWLLVSHAPVDEEAREVWSGRDNLTAWVSEDEGESWIGGLLLDERFPVSYPDVAQAEDGTIGVVYDFNRKVDREILFARFTEEDVVAGRTVSEGGRLGILVRGPK